MTTISRSQGYQFSQLNTYFQDSLFGVKFDYNNWISPSESLHFLNNLITGENITEKADPDLTSNNLLALIGHDFADIQSAFLAVESIKRTEIVPFLDPIEWETSLPFIKYVLEYALPSGENIILSQDFLGIALKLSGQDFTSDDYQVGYANIPLDFLDFISSSMSSDQKPEYSIESITQPKQIPLYSNTTPMTIEIQETQAGLSITTTYTDITYLFQRDDIDYEQISSMQLSDHFILLQFDNVSITLNMLKFSKPTNSGVETCLDVRLGNIKNLIINENFPTVGNWSDSTEVKVEGKYRDLIDLNETFSWYKNNDILKRIANFDHASFSLLLSQSFGILNGTHSDNEFQLKIAGNTVKKEDLAQRDILVQENVTISRENDLFYFNQLKGNNYVLKEDPVAQNLSVDSLKYKLISLNQHSSLSNNMLFLRETDLLNDLVAESVKHFIEDETITSLSTDQLLKSANLYLTSAMFIQDFEIENWRGYPSTLKIKHSAVRDLNYVKIKLSDISSYPFLASVLPVVILIKAFKKKKDENKS